MRMLFTPERLQRARKSPHWPTLRARGAELLKTEWTTEARAEQGVSQHANYIQPARELADLVETLSLLHLVEPDERYAAKIRAGLLFYANYQYWSGTGLRQRVPPWRSELVTASFCQAYGIGYDVLRDWLTPVDRKRIAGALADKGVLPILQDWLLPETRFHALDSMGHNWWMVCLALAGIGAIALRGEHPDADKWIEAIERSVPQWFEFGGNVLQNKVANFDASGAYYEGVGYANFALMEYLLYRIALADERSADLPLLRQVEQFFLHTLYPTRDGFLTVNFGDHKITTAATSTMRLLLANGFASPRAKWYVDRTAKDQAHPLALLFDRDEPAESPHKLPTSIHFPGVNWAVLRSSWDDDATLLAVRSGTFWGHAHADPGTFVLFHRGQQLIADAGMCDYSRPEYRNYYMTGQAHNVVLVNGAGAPAEDFLRGSKFPGTVQSLVDEGGFKYVYADATGPMAHALARHYRHWLWVDGAIVIFDDLLAHQPARFQWLLHGAEAAVQMLYPGDLQIRRPTAPAQDNPDKQTSYLEFSTTTDSRQHNFIAVIGLESVPARLLQGPEWLGVQLATTTVYFNLRADGRRQHENSNAEIEGWETDAYLLAVSPTHLLVIDGSYVRRDGKVVLDSLAKVNRVVAL